MTLLEQILQKGYPSTPIKIESGQGMGELQKAARNLTLGKIIFILCKEGPLTKYQIANMGNIHKSNLGSEKDTITHRLNDLIKLGMIIKHKPVKIHEGITGGIKTKYMFTYYLANWDNRLTKIMFLWYRDQFQPSYFYLTEYEELEQELDMQMRTFKHFDKHDPEVLKTVILQEEIPDLYSCAEMVKPIDKKTGQAKEGVNLEGMTKCANKLKELKDKPVEYRDNLIQLLRHANIHKDPITVDEPSKVIRELLKQRMLKLDSLGHLDQRGNIHQLSKLENLVSGKSVVVVFELIVKLKIENKLPDFIGAWKRLSSVASKSEVLITN
jgi:predicted transcriptional regulator